MQLWRVLLGASAIILMIGGPLHPGGDMAQMLADPNWIPSHVLQLVSYSALVAALVVFGRQPNLPSRTRRWTRIAVIGALLQTTEMVAHTVAYVDHAHLVAGHATPVLSTHLAMSIVFYPAFGIAMIAFIVATARERTLASPWIAWLGVVGAAAHASAPPLVVGLGLLQARILFPMVMLFGLWMLLASLWPVRAAQATASSAKSSAR
jgi:hypothetical protein